MANLGDYRMLPNRLPRRKEVAQMLVKTAQQREIRNAALASRPSIMQYVDFGMITYAAVKSLVTELRKKAPNRAKVIQQVTMVVDEVNDMFRVNISADMVDKCLAAVLAVVAETR